MRCKAGRTRGPADEDFELSRFYHLKRGAAGGGGEDEEEDECRMVNIQPVLAVDFFLSLPFEQSTFHMICGPHHNKRIQI